MFNTVVPLVVVGVLVVVVVVVVVSFARPNSAPASANNSPGFPITGWPLLWLDANKRMRK